MQLSSSCVNVPWGEKICANLWTSKSLVPVLLETPMFHRPSTVGHQMPKGKTIKAFASHPNEISLSSLWWAMGIWGIWKPLECFFFLTMLHVWCSLHVEFEFTVLPPPLRTEYKPTLFTVFHIRGALHMLLQNHACLARCSMPCLVQKTCRKQRHLVWSWFGSLVSQSSTGIPELKKNAFFCFQYQKWKSKEQ